MTKKNFAVLGLGRFGTAVALTLSNMGHNVLAVDPHEECVANVADVVTQAVVANATEERVLRQLDIGSFDCIIVGVGSDLATSILIIVQCKELGAPYIIAKAANELQARVLVKIGADRAVTPEQETGVRLAQSLIDENVLDTLPLSPDYSITERTLPASWVGQSIASLNVRARYGVNIIAVKRNAQANLSFAPDFTFQQGDVLVLAGSNADLNTIEVE